MYLGHGERWSRRLLHLAFFEGFLFLSSVEKLLHLR